MVSGSERAVKLAVIGAGKWGINHIRSLYELGLSPYAIVDVDPGKKVIANKYKSKFFTRYEDVLDEVDAVIVATPTDTHYEIVKNCLKAGKHVLVEKPIAGNSRQGKELVNIADKMNLILSVGYLYRFNNSIRRLKEIINEIGEIQYITSRYIHSTKPPRKDSGVIMNLGIHVVDILNFTLDKIPRKVYAVKKNLLSEVYEDSAVMTLGYDDFFASIELSCSHPLKARDMWIIAEKEKVYIDFFNQKMVRYPIKVSHEKIEKKEPIEEKINRNEPLKEELKYFITLVEEGEVEENLGRENYYTTRICELCLKSAELGKELIVE